jgi:hypothetical protein
MWSQPLPVKTGLPTFIYRFVLQVGVHAWNICATAKYLAAGQYLALVL